jgi:DNA-binding HxlR family transcriptional regulator
LSTPRHTEGSCEGFRDALTLVGEKWSILIVYSMHDGPKRFSELKRMVTGVSQRMLTLSLRKLERDGLVTRTMQATIPPRVDYELTQMGQDLLKPVGALFTWAMENRGKIEKQRRRYDSRDKNSGQ